MRRIYHRLGLILALAAVPAGFAYAPSGWRLEGLRYWPRAGLLLCLASALACLVLLREKTPPAVPWAAAALALVCAVQALTPEDRDLLLLRFHTGLTVKEIAHMQNKKPAAVAKAVTRAKARLAERLREEGFDLD